MIRALFLIWAAQALANDCEFLNEANETMGTTRHKFDDIAGFLQTLAKVNAENCATNDLLANISMHGIVQQYGKKRFKSQAEIAVNRANFLTRMWRDAPVENANFYNILVQELFESDPQIFGAGNCYEYREFPGKETLFCPFISKVNDSTRRFSMIDLSTAYNYSFDRESSEWFFIPRSKAKKRICESATLVLGDKILEVTYEDGHWSDPYFDCGAGNIWMMTYTVGFFGYRSDQWHFKGTSGIDIDLQEVDIDQCPQSAGSTELNVFAGTSKCRETTKCVTLTGLGFRRGNYKCVCQGGFYFPNKTALEKFFHGEIIEYEYEQQNHGAPSIYNRSFTCIRCPEHCDNCTDGRPCVLHLKWTQRIIILVMNLLVMLCIPYLVFFTVYFSQIKVLKAASPVLLRIILLGAFLLYCTIIISYLPVSEFVCCARVWCRELGFSISYGALLLKTWRISVVFRVRSAQRIRISDMDLIKRLGIIVAVVIIFLGVRMAFGRPQVVTGRHSSGLKAFQCSFDPWDWCSAAAELGFLMWGIRLCIVVRSAPSEFNESRFISWAIYNETLLSIFLNVVMYFVRSPNANPDLAFLIQFLHTQLTTTVTLSFLFGTKAYLVHHYWKLGKTEHDNHHGARFITKREKNRSSWKQPNLAIGATSTTKLGDGLDDEDYNKDVQDELKRIYSQMEALRHMNMKLDNRHLAAKKDEKKKDEQAHVLNNADFAAINDAAAIVVDLESLKIATRV